MSYSMFRLVFVPLRQRPRPLLLGVLAAVALLAGVGGRAVGEGAQPERRQELVVFFDRSESMNQLVPGSTQTYYQAAVAAAIEEIRFALESGTPVRVVPFHEVTTQNPQDTLSTPGALPLDEQLTTIRNVYLEKPVPGRGARIADTVLAVMPLLCGEGRRSAVSVYTAEQDKSAVPWAQVPVKLKDRFGEQAPEIKVRDPAKGFPSYAAVKVSGAPILDADAFANGADGAAGKGVDVQASFSASAGAANTLDVVKNVEVTKLKADAPDLAVTAVMPSALNGGGAAAARGKAVLTAHGKFPPGQGRYEYVLRFSFQFQSMPRGTPDILVAAQPVRLVVASELKPTAQVTVDKTELRLRPHEYKDVVVSVAGNDAAAGKACQIRALVTGTGLSSEFFAPDQKEPAADAHGTPNEIAVTLPAGGARQEVVMRVRADRKVKGQVVVGAQVAAATTATPPINVDVQPPIVRAALGGTGERVELDDAAAGTFKDLLHPIGLKVESAPKGLSATLSVVGDDKDVEVAFEDEQGKKVNTVTVPLDGSASVPLFGRLKSLAPSTPPTMPAVKVELSSPDVVVDPADGTIALDGAAGLRAADVWLSSGEAGGQPPTGTAGGRTLVLPPRKVRFAQRDEREVVLQWNRAAIGSSIAVAAESPDGGRVLSISLVDAGASGAIVLDPANPWRLMIPRASAGVRELPTSAHIKIGFEAPGPGQGAKRVQHRVVFTLTPPQAPPAPSAQPTTRPAPWNVLAVYDVAPTLLTAEVVKAAAAPFLYVGVKQPVPIATLRATSDGLPGKIRARFVPNSPGDALAITIGEEGSDSIGILPSGGGGPAERGVTLFAQPTGGTLSKAGKKITGQIEIDAVPADANDLNPMVRLGDNGSGAAAQTSAVEFEVKACSLRALYKGAECQSLPAQGPRFLVSGSNAVLDTATSVPPVSFELVGADDLPDEIADKVVTARATETAGLIQSVKFEVAGKDPQDTVTLRDLRDGKVRGLVIKAAADNKSDGQALRDGQVTVEVADLGTSLTLPVKMRVPAGGNDLLYIVLGSAGVVVLLVVGRKVLRPRTKEEERDGDEPMDGSLLGGGPSPASAGAGTRGSPPPALRPASPAAEPRDSAASEVNGDGHAEAPPTVPAHPAGEDESWTDPGDSLLG